jgi:anti-sigma factor (TIGR02949 family)
VSGAISCAETFRRLDDYIDRELSPAELKAVEDHLEICAVCAAEFGIERTVLEEIRGKLRRLRAPDGLLRRISARLRNG